MSDNILTLNIQEVDLAPRRRRRRRQRQAEREPDRHLWYLANGMGGQSMYLLWAMGQGRLPGRVSITADTGNELDCHISTGERMTAAAFYERYVMPLAAEWDIESYFVRARDREGTPMPSLWDYTGQFIADGRPNHIKQPLFGSNGGRLRQSCTQRFKIQALRQQVKAMGYKSATSLQGIHLGEAIRRMNGANPRQELGLLTVWDDIEGSDDGEPRVSGTWSHAYPLVEWRMDRAAVSQELERLGIPYIIGSLCDDCPHKGRAHWLRTDPDVIKLIAAREAQLGGQFFYTDQRRPILEVLADWQQQADGLMGEDEDTIGCDNGGVCGV